MIFFKKYNLFFATLFLFKSFFAVDAYYKLASFYVPNQGPFIETYLTIGGKSAELLPVKGGYQSSVNVQLLISDINNKIVVANKYNLKSPVYSDTNNISSFIDNQRYPLKNGTYTVEISVSDNYLINTKTSKIIQVIKISYANFPIQASSIQILESFKKSETTSAITKSGYDLVPYTVDYFPDSQNKLAFYFESYNTDTVLGKNKAFIYKYYIESNDNYKPIEDFSSFKKVTTAKVNPLLAQFDITKLKSGNYNLVIEIRDEKNIIQLQEKYFFQRQTKTVSSYDVSNKPINDLEKFFYNVNSVDTLKIYIECLWPISDMLERDRQINQTVKKDTSLMRKYLVSYWTNRAADSANPMSLWLDYLKSVNETAALFKCGKQKGYYTDRGRVYLQYGKPNQRTVQVAEANTFPYEIWQYYRLYDKVNGQFFSNRKFVFVNKNIADDCYMLEHSDMRGEVNNERWRFEVMKRNSDGIQNIDNNNPGGSSNNQFNDLYNSPR